MRPKIRIAGLVMAVFASTVYADSLSRILDLRQTIFSGISQIQQMALSSKEVFEETKTRMAEAPFLCQGRLTLSSGTPVPTTDLANQSTLYFTPYEGSRIALYDGANWDIYTFTERSLTLSGLTASTNYDVFIYDNAGTLTLELTAWSSATARATAITQIAGVYVRSGSTTRRYLGTIRATAATQTQDTASQRFVWNYYNRVKRRLELLETGDSWSYTTAAMRNVNNNTANDIEVVQGLQESPVFLRGMLLTTADGTSRENISTSFGIDSTTSITLTPRGGSARNTLRQQIWTETIQIDVGLGYHSIEWLEYGNATACTFYGDDGGDARVQSGVTGYIDG